MISLHKDSILVFTQLLTETIILAVYSIYAIDLISIVIKDPMIEYFLVGSLSTFNVVEECWR